MVKTIRTSSKKQLSNKKKEKVPTLLEAIECVVMGSEDSKMSDEFMVEAAPVIGFLADSYGITERQAVLFCICMEKGPRRVDYDDIASHLGIKKIKALSFASDIDALVRRRLLRFRDVKDEDDFDIPTAVIRELKHNRVWQMPKRTGLDCAEMFELLDQMFEDLSDDAISAKELREELDTLFNDNPQVGFVRHVNELGLHNYDRLLLVFFCHLFINKDDEDVRFGQMEDLYDSEAIFNKEKSLLRSGQQCLQTRKLIEYCCEDGMANNTRYKLTESAKRELLGELNINASTEKLAEMMRPEELTEKHLFYSQDNERQVKELHSFLRPEEYNKIHERLKQTGFRQGFACLFYGAPGTGKTETVYQLARQTGRSIFVVDVPKIKSMWVGQSEKNIKALFDRYREQVRRNEQAPILLFNEADAIIGIRKNGANSAVDKMENSIQNIILQEMEQLDGILIATTNLADNLDKAFERRFLYKIKFDKPDASVRRRIWQQMIGELTDAEADRLATAHELSGGQIENVARKYTVSTILHGCDASQRLQTLTDYCREERLESGNVRKVGF